MYGFICNPPAYQYKGWLFEFSTVCGPWPIRKDGELRKRAGDKFYKVWKEWYNQPDREKYRIGGGCEKFEM